MKRLLPLVCCVGCLGAWLPSAWSQDSAAAAAAVADRQAAEERYQRLSSAVDDLVAAQAVMEKRVGRLEDSIRRLRNGLAQANTNAGNFVSRAEFNDLVQKLKELDQQRIKDRDLILQKIQDLAKVSAAPPAAASPPTPSSGEAASQEGSRYGYRYKIQPRDTLAAIVAAYRAKGIKVTLAEVEKANPGLNPRRLRVGQVVFIPDHSLHHRQPDPPAHKTVP